MALAAAIVQARLAAGLGVAELAKRLNMGVEQLEALESGDLDRLPEQVFVIAQARRIAQNLGVTIDGEIQALRQSGSLNTRPIELQNLKPKAEPEEHRGPAANQAPRSGGVVPVLASLALAGGVAAGSVALWQQWQGRQLAAIQAKPVLTKPVQVNPVQTKQALTKPATTKKATTKQAQAAARDQAPAKTGAASLTLSSGSNTWLEVKTLKGKQLFRGDFKGRKGFPLNEGLRVLAGRPDLLLVQVGGTAARPLGSISEVTWQTFAAPKAPAPSGTARRPPEPRPGKQPGSNAPG
jgi:cytoskeletal protein RodZ